MTAARTPTLAAGLVAALVLSACGASAATPSGSAPPDPTAVSDAPSPSASEAPPSVAPSEVPSQAPASDPVDDLGPFACETPVEGTGTTPRAQIVDVRVGEHAGYDRVVVEFANGTPEFHLTIEEPPFFADGSGLPIEVEGSAFWQLRMPGGTRQGESGGITYDGPTSFEPGFERLVHLVEGGDFEAQATWLIGTAGEACVRVLTLQQPPRLVIDLEH